MDINNYFDEIMKYSHCLNWEPDWEIVKKIYNLLSLRHARKALAIGEREKHI